MDEYGDDPSIEYIDIEDEMRLVGRMARLADALALVHELELLPA